MSQDVGVGLSASLPEFVGYFIREVAEIQDRDLADELAGKIARSLERQFPFRYVVVLGHGYFGAAAEIPERKVLKITLDASEVEVAHLLSGETLSHVVSFHGAWFLKGQAVFHPGYEAAGPVGVLVSGMVDHVGLGNSDADDDLTHAVNQVKQDYDLWDLWQKDLRKPDLRERLCQAAMDLEDRLLELGGPASEIALGLEELRYRGICAIDAHANNVGYDERTEAFRIFDVGLASSSRKPRVPRMAGRRPPEDAR